MSFIACNKHYQNTSQYPTSNTKKVVFIKGKYEDILEKAQKLQKPVFVDVYTSWCMPCKQMDSNVFNNPEVATQFNDNFVCYKLDGDSKYADEFFKKHQVIYYPTLFIMNQYGEVIEKSEGFTSREKLLEMSNSALKLP